MTSERDDSRLVEYLYGELSVDEARAFEDADPSAVDEARDLADVLAVAREIDPPIDPPSFLDAKILAAARQRAGAETEAKSVRGWRRWLTGPALGGALAAVAASMLVVLNLPLLDRPAPEVAAEIDMSERAALAPARPQSAPEPAASAATPVAAEPPSGAGLARDELAQLEGAAASAKARRDRRPAPRAGANDPALGDESFEGGELAGASVENERAGKGAGVAQTRGEGSGLRGLGTTGAARSAGDATGKAADDGRIGAGSGGAGRVTAGLDAKEKAGPETVGSVSEETLAKDVPAKESKKAEATPAEAPAVAVKPGAVAPSRAEADDADMALQAADRAKAPAPAAPPPKADAPHVPADGAPTSGDKRNDVDLRADAAQRLAHAEALIVQKDLAGAERALVAGRSRHYMQPTGSWLCLRLARLLADQQRWPDARRYALEARSWSDDPAMRAQADALLARISRR